MKIIKTKGLLFELLPYTLAGLITLLLMLYFGIARPYSSESIIPLFLLSIWAYFAPLITALIKAKNWTLKISLAFLFVLMILAIYYFGGMIYFESYESDYLLLFWSIFLIFAPPFSALLFVVAINYLKK